MSSLIGQAKLTLQQNRTSYHSEGQRYDNAVNSVVILSIVPNPRPL